MLLEAKNTTCHSNTGRLVFSQSFYPSTSKNLELKAKKIATRPKTGNFKTNPSMKRLKKKQPVPKLVISIPTRPRKG
jgi:hypothetical protein